MNFFSKNQTQFTFQIMYNDGHKVKGENVVFQQINPTGDVLKLFIIDVSALKPFSTYIQCLTESH